jgi:hypothetical protein
MLRAWGLHYSAQFKDIGDNIFVVRFSSEGDWRHAMKNGPWQFDFHAVLLKDYDGATRPSDMVFDSVDIWVRVLDLPMDMMNRVYGELIGGWIGKYISVEVDEDGMAWGEELRIRVAVRVDQPLPRGVPLKESDEDEESRWFDLKYEKVPHFCFQCGCIVHSEGRCLRREEDGKQWGEWLRASPRKNKKPPPPPRPSVSSSSFSSRGTSSEARHFGGVSIRDLPPRRNLSNEFSYSGSSRTGGKQSRGGEVSVTSPEKHNQRPGKEDYGGNKVPIKERLGKRPGTFRRHRKEDSVQAVDHAVLTQGIPSKKRGTRQVWRKVQVQVIGEDESESSGKRQRTESVFNRLEDPAADPAAQGRRDQ